MNVTVKNKVKDFSVKNKILQLISNKLLSPCVFLGSTKYQYLDLIWRPIKLSMERLKGLAPLASRCHFTIYGKDLTTFSGVLFSCFHVFFMCICVCAFATSVPNYEHNGIAPVFFKILIMAVITQLNGRIRLQ